MTVLLAGIPSEPPLRLAIEAAEALAIDHLVLDQRHAAGHDLVLDAGPAGLDGELALAAAPGGRRLALAAVAGVYVRLTDPAVLPPAGAPTSDAAARAGAFCELFDAWLDLAPCRVANRPRAMASNGSKPYQSQLIARCGFRVPATLVTNDPDAARRFAARHGRVVYKSTSSVRSVVRELTPEALARLDRVRRLPTQFQELVPGVDVRVHVVGAATFACEARSDAVDYRYAARDGSEVRLRPLDLDGDVQAACLALAAALDLPFCGIDLRRAPDGSWACFEVNPSPAYSWYEEETGQPVARALVRHLAGCPS
jgi:hypothetical protein